MSIAWILTMQTKYFFCGFCLTNVQMSASQFSSQHCRKTSKGHNSYKKWIVHPLPHLTQRNLLQEVQVAAKEFLPQSIVQVERHTVLAHLIIRLRPAVTESLMSPAKLHNGGGIRHSESSAKWLKECVIMRSSRCLWKKFWRHHGAAISVGGLWLLTGWAFFTQQSA